MLKPSRSCASVNDCVLPSSFFGEPSSGGAAGPPPRAGAAAPGGSTPYAHAGGVVAGVCARMSTDSAIVTAVSPRVSPMGPLLLVARGAPPPLAARGSRRSLAQRRACTARASRLSHHAPRTTHHAPRTTHYALRTTHIT